MTPPANPRENAVTRGLRLRLRSAINPPIAVAEPAAKLNRTDSSMRGSAFHLHRSSMPLSEIDL